MIQVSLPALIYLTHPNSAASFMFYGLIWNVTLFRTTSVYIFLGTGNFSLPIVALDPYLIVVNSFTVEWRDTELRSSENAWSVIDCKSVFNGYVLKRMKGYFL